MYQKINKFKNSWVPMNTHGYFNTHGTARTRVWYLSNGTDTGFILSVPMDTHWHPYSFLLLFFPSSPISFFLNYFIVTDKEKIITWNGICNEGRSKVYMCWTMITNIDIVLQPIWCIGSGLSCFYILVLW